MSLFETLQQDVGEWSQENFPDQPDVNPYIGTSEEMGEFADRVDLTSAPNEEELDAVGDILVYFADFCYIRDLDYQGAIDQARSLDVYYENFFREWLVARGKLSRSVLKQRQGIRTDEDRVGTDAEQNALAHLLACLLSLAEQRGYTLRDCVITAWNDEVSDREWDSSYKSKTTTN